MSTFGLSALQAQVNHGTHYSMRTATGLRREITPEWFLERVEKTPTCWLWRGTLNGKQGYGYVLLAVKPNGKRLFTTANRVAYQLWKGPLEGRLHVCHTCDNPQCVNPDHLFLGTPRDNSRDMWAKGRHPMPDMAKRPNFNKALMTPRAARRVIELRKQGVPIKEIVQRVFYVAVRGTVSHNAWKRVRQQT